MEKESDSKGKLESNSPHAGRSKSFSFRAPQEKFTIQDFELGKIYGVGSYSKVVRAMKKDTGNVYALKIMDKKFITKENKAAYVKLERIVLDQLDHPDDILWMQKGRLSEDEARFYAAEAVEALEYIHTMGLIHRDLKCEANARQPNNCPTERSIRNDYWPFPDDKACTFVGTAAYVPPEVLNSSPATFGNDLWALGCTVYQMLAGTSPFKDSSEWLIFQRIVARDLRFPDYFSNDARDLVDRLLDMDPRRRPGAGPDGYSALKSHRFFEGIDWKNLRSRTPPKLAMEQRTRSAHGGNDRDGSQNHSHAADASARANEGNDGASPSSDAASSITKLAAVDSFDSRWQEFLEPGEIVLMASVLKKMQKLTSKKVQLILTSKPRLIYVDPAKLVVKGNIIWSDNPNELSVQAASPSQLKICTPKKILLFEDSKQKANQWKKAIEALQHRAKYQKNVEAYHNKGSGMKPNIVPNCIRSESYTIAFEVEEEKFPFFGKKYQLKFANDISAETQCLVHFPSLIRLAREAGLDYIEIQNLTDFYDDYRPQFVGMLQDVNHNLIDPRGRLLPRAYDVLGLFTTFVFRKPDPDIAPPLMTPFIVRRNNDDEASEYNSTKHILQMIPMDSQGIVWRDDEKNGQVDSSQGLGKITEQKGILGQEGRKGEEVLYVVIRLVVLRCGRALKFAKTSSMEALYSLYYFSSTSQELQLERESLSKFCNATLRKDWMFAGASSSSLSTSTSSDPLPPRCLAQFIASSSPWRSLLNGLHDH
nr:3-phosphoinositide-dependent protein kinase 2-like isoform X2 [Ipomoea trifida]